MHDWLYGDGASTKIWYHSGLGIFVGLISSVCLIAAMLRRFVEAPWWFAVSYGFISVFLTIAASISASLVVYYADGGGYPDGTEDFSGLYFGTSMVVCVAAFLLSSYSPVPDRHRSVLATIFSVLLGLYLILMVPTVQLRESMPGLLPFITFATASMGGLFALDAVRFGRRAIRFAGGIAFLLLAWFIAFEVAWKYRTQNSLIVLVV